MTTGGGDEAEMVTVAALCPRSLGLSGGVGAPAIPQTLLTHVLQVRLSLLMLPLSRNWLPPQAAALVAARALGAGMQRPPSLDPVDLDAVAARPDPEIEATAKAVGSKVRC